MSARRAHVVASMVAAAAAVAVLGACGAGAGSHAEQTTTGPHAPAVVAAPQSRSGAQGAEAGPSAAGGPAALARAASIRASDLPTYWARVGRPLPSVRCHRVDPFRSARTTATTPPLRYGYAGTQEVVAVYRTTRAARAARRLLDSPAATRCLSGYARAQIRAHTGGEPEPLRIVRMERLGRWGQATRYRSSTVTDAGLVRTYLDVVRLHAGAGVAALVIVSGSGPVSEGLYDRLVGLAVERFRDAFGAHAG